MPTITPVTQIERRAPEAGRIRLGVKTQRAMKAIDSFRFTSPYEEQIRKIADLYGGDPVPWSDSRARIQNQWEVLTPATEINVFLPVDGLSQSYELWSGGGRERSCDGETCEIIVRQDTERTPCICDAKGVAECRLTTRLNVILPELPFRGQWRLETKGWNAGHEMPGMFDLASQLQAAGRMSAAKLSLEKRSDTKGGQKRNYVVPIVSIADSPAELAAGQSSLTAIQQAGATPEVAGALMTGSVDAEVVEAEIVSDELLEVEDMLRGDAIQFDLDPDRFVAAVRKQTSDDIERMHAAHDKITQGTLEPVRFKPNGTVDWATPDA